eukprot:m51a1_g14059 putative transcriptional antiterminator (758) ;mRNA; r:1215980-1218588
MGEGRIIMVANRLPVSAHCGPGGVTFARSNGGLVSGLSSVRCCDVLWVGWPGPVADHDLQRAREFLRAQGLHPVFLPQDLSEKFYEGYCNGALWPMFHSMSSFSKSLDEEYAAFLEVTRLFAREIVRLYRPGDTIWIHDYHLLMLPRELRRLLGGEVRMAFFLHIPFPHVDVLRLLPNHVALVESLLQVDLLGLHTPEYVSNFIGCASRLHGVCFVLGRALVPAPAPKHGHLIQVSAFPMGIDFARWRMVAESSKCAQAVRQLRARLNVEKVVFSVSRLDYTKGLPEALRAVRAFLQESPGWASRVAFVFVVVPSRTGVDRYAELKCEVDKLVGEINGEFSTPAWTPVVYMYRSLPVDDLAVLYAASDVGLIIPLRDGMNLCAKEYVAVHAEGPGVLILSDLAGAAKELIEAVVVNPNSIDSVIGGLRSAFAMPAAEQVERNRKMAFRLASSDVGSWTASIFKSLADAKEMQKRLEVCEMDDEGRRALVSDFISAKNRLVVLDYDGTLVPFVNNPADAKPDEDLLVLLSDLAHVPRTTVLVLSGRDRHTLGEWLGHLPIDLAAEHGSWSWTRNRGRWEKNVKVFCDDKWKQGVRPEMEAAARMLPGSMIEEKEFSLVFHYRASYSAFHAVERQKVYEAVMALKSNITSNTAGLPVRVLDAKEALEVKTIGSSKGDFFVAYINDLSPAPDFILTMGDDQTDEDMFEAQTHGHSVRVGLFPSRARRNVLDHEEARALLSLILAGTSNGSHPIARFSFSI